ncbi:MAG: hypothetical protein KGJ06_00885 [Pseudomonadota bacterium]|nr:hypothetical protein [Pseudomonadota bacterium]
MQLSRSTQFTLEGKGVITLTPNDHVATGGEGSIYRKAGTVVKLYTDPKKMRKDGMSEKVRLLSQLDHPFIVTPKGIVLGSRDEPLGFYMNWVEGEPLSRIFTNDFRQREGFTDGNASQLVDGMRQVVLFAHDHDAIMVDANELNWLCILHGRRKSPEPRVIDVDSWAIGRWPAKVIMPSIRDYHTQGFTHASDWFSAAVVWFQIYTGIHPYKGGLDGYKPAELERRMKDSASVFTPGVRLNHAVRDFKCIPAKLRMWFEATFQHGERTIPPSPFDTTTIAPKAAVVSRMVSMVTGLLVYDRLYLASSKDPAVRIFPCGVVLLQSGRLYDLAAKRVIGTVKSPASEVVQADGYWLVADHDGSDFVFSCINSTSLQKQELMLMLKGHRLVRYENRLFLVTDQGLTELLLKHLGKPILTIGQTWGAMLNSTKWLDGVGVQQGLGATYLIAPFADKACAHVRVKELDGFTPVAAKAGNRFIAVMCVDASGEYRKFELSMSKDYSTYKLWQGGAESPELNLAILPKGVAAIIVEDTKLHLFVPSSSTLKKVEDKDITTAMILGNWGDTVVYLQGGNVWSVHMK